MNPEIKALWLKELRDPKNKQTRGVLKNRSGARCCLGVLTDIVQPGSLTWNSIDKIYTAPTGSPGQATPEVLTLAGLNGIAQSRLISRNDGETCYAGHENGVHFKRHDFQQIADFIEKEL